MRPSRKTFQRVPQTRIELRNAIEKVAVSIETFTSLPDWDSFASAWHDVIIFLASEQARWVTGQLIYASGGFNVNK